MGAKQSHNSPHYGRFSLDQWQECPLTPYTNIKDPSYGSNFSLYANRLNPSLQLEKYDLFFNSYPQLLAYKQLANWRNTIRHVVQVNHIQQPGKKQFCGAFHHAQAFLQRSPIRLVQIQDISLEEGLCIIYCAVLGFEQLYSKFGYFEPQAELICFNREGFVKVWVNQNLSKNHPENIYVQSKNKNYNYFIQQLLTLLEKLIDFEGQKSISEFISTGKISDPYQQMVTVLELYAKQRQISVPRYLNSIRNICMGRKRKNQLNGRDKPRSKIQNRPSISSKNSNKLQLDEQFFSYPNHHTMREPLEELRFKKVASFNENYRYLSQTSRPSPPVRFHYNRTSPGSPINMNDASMSFLSKGNSPFTSPERYNESKRPVSFLKTKRSLKGQPRGIDAQLAANMTLDN